MDLNKAIEISQSEVSQPGELSECRLWLAGQYAYLNNQLIGILKNKPQVWNEIRYSGKVKSDTAAERLWEMSEMGLKEMEINKTLKSIEKISSAIKSRLDTLQGELRNQF